MPTFSKRHRKTFFSFFLEIKDERYIQKAIPTADGLEIINSDENLGSTFYFNPSVTDEEHIFMREFLCTTIDFEIFTFILNAKYDFILSPGYKEGVLELVVESLKSIGL